jgi:hypothetical protein
MVGLLVTCGVFFLMFMVGFVLPNYFAGIAAVAASQGGATAREVTEKAGDPLIGMRFAYPNSLDSWLLSPELPHVFEGLGVFLAYAVVTCLGGSLVFARRDV